MIWTITKYILLALLVYILLREAKLLKSYLRLNKASQSDGLYFPFLGVIFHFMVYGKKPDPLKWMKDRVSEHAAKGKQWLTISTPFFDKPLVMLTDEKLISEFFLREKEIALRQDFQREPPILKLGFFYKND